MAKAAKVADQSAVFFGSFLIPHFQKWFHPKNDRQLEATKLWVPFQ